MNLKPMKIKSKTIFILFVFFSFCKNSNNENRVEEKWPENKSGFMYWEPSENHLEIINEVLDKAIENNEFYFLEKPIKKSIKNHQLQFLTYTNENKERMLQLNAYCDDFALLQNEMNSENGDLKNNEENLDKSAFCVWGIVINMDKKTYEDIIVFD